MVFYLHKYWAIAVKVIMKCCDSNFKTLFDFDDQKT